MQYLEIRRPDDWHLHVRDGAALAAVLPWTARQFARALIMPNLRPPVTTVAAAAAYRQRVLAARPAGSDFEPCMTLYLTDRTTPAEIEAAAKSGFVLACKLYPAGATTYSESGVTALEHALPAIEAMERHGVALCVHGEETDPRVDVFDREAVFIERTLAPLVERFPALKVVFEHITTEEAARFVAEARPGVAATLTAHHLLYNRNAMFQGGVRPHYYCLPVLKRERHRIALVKAATSGSPRFFLGTDSAPHAAHTKEAACGCAGCFTAHAALELYAEAFEGAGALERLEGFASEHGARFYGLPLNPGKIRLVHEPSAVPERLPFVDDSALVPLRAGESLRWRLDAGASAAQ